MFKLRKSLSKSDSKEVKTYLLDLDELFSTPTKQNIFSRIYWGIRNKLDTLYYGYFVNKRQWIVKTSLPPRPWHDEDTVMLYAIMAVFERFYYNEMQDKMDLDYDEWQGNEPLDFFEKEKVRFLHFRKEVKEIHEWWSKYEDRVKQIYKLSGREYREALDKLNEEEQEILHRIVNIRPQMWT